MSATTVNRVKVKTYFVKGFKVCTEVKFLVGDELLTTKKIKTEIPTTHRKKESLIAFKESLNKAVTKEMDSLQKDSVKFTTVIEELQYNEMIKEDKKENEKTFLQMILG